MFAADAAFRCALAIERSETLAAIQDEVRAFSMPFGYNRFVLFSVAAAKDELVERLYWVHGDWFGADEEVDAETYIQRCPVTRHILEVRQAFFWTKTMEADGELYRIVQLPRGGGIHGLQVPVFGPLGLEGAMSLGGEKIDSSPQVRLALVMIAESAFLAARRLLEMPASDESGILSDREREVLTWTAAGRRQSEIAVALNLSERTIENHLRRIRKRLRVATTAQAIRVAIRNGEIAA